MLEILHFQHHLLITYTKRYYCLLLTRNYFYKRDQLMKATIYSNTTITLTSALHSEGDVNYPPSGNQLYAITGLLEAPSRCYTITSQLEAYQLHTLLHCKFVTINSRINRIYSNRVVTTSSLTDSTELAQLPLFNQKYCGIPVHLNIEYCMNSSLTIF